MQLDKYSLIAQGVYIEHITPVGQLSQLATRLRPLKTQYDLIRVGSENDGGYLVPNDLVNIKTCFSPGVDINASFEQDLLKNHHIASHLVDFSVEGPPPGFAAKSFTKKYLGALDDEVFISLDRWVLAHADLNDPEDFILQMDIEGGEYAAILGASEEVLRKFRIIVIEIHDIEAWGQPTFFRLVQTFFDKLLKNFSVLHNHPNNCCGIVNLGGFLAPRVFELTLLRKDRVIPMGFSKLFPHVLDRPNLVDREDLVLPENWYASRPKLPLHSIDYFLNEITGLIHIGANTGQERALYEGFDLEVAWIEALPEIYEQLILNLREHPKQVAYKVLLSDQDGIEYDFRVANNGGGSSSIFDFALHKEIWPKVDYLHSIKIKSKTLSSFIRANDIPIQRYQALVLDTQGSELLILKGTKEYLDQFEYIKAEAADFESYKGCCKLAELTDFLSQQGFREAQRETLIHHQDIGNYYDVLYKREIAK